MPRTGPTLSTKNAMPPDTPDRPLMGWLLSNDPQQRIRIAMAGFSSVLMVCCVVIVNLMAVAGLARPDWVQWWSLFTGLGLVAVAVLIRTGWARHLRDPSLTQFQIRYALLCNAAAYVILGPARGIALAILSLILLFGIFGMSPRQMVANLFYALALFGAAFVAVAWLDEPGRLPAVEAAYAAMVVLVLLGSTFVTVRLNQIRRRLTRQKTQLSRALERIGHLATHDELTGLVNRRHMAQLLATEHLRCERSGQPLVLALLDLDHFKLINDTHGHAMGDQALRAFATAVQAMVRGTDVLARWGGEEFVLMLPDTDPAAAGPLLERLRLNVQALAVPAQGDSVRITVSIGLATGVPGESVERILERADQALYRAKARGRNQVVRYDAPA